MVAVTFPTAGREGKEKSRSQDYHTAGNSMVIRGTRPGRALSSCIMARAARSGAAAFSLPGQFLLRQQLLFAAYFVSDSAAM
jgi:hypothetical protein